MNEQERLRAAKKETLRKIGDLVEGLDQVGEFSWASLEEVNGEEAWTIVSIIAKKKTYSPDDDVAEWQFAKEQLKKKLEQKEKLRVEKEQEN